MKYEYKTIDPETAREWLESNKANRPLRGDQVKAYARDMRNDQWHQVGDPLRFDYNGNIIDGQHRLAAVVESGKSIPFMVIAGLDPEDQKVIDSGVKRRAADQFVFDGHKLGARIAAVARLGLSIEMRRPYDNSLRLTNTELFAYVDRNPGLTGAIIDVEGKQRATGITPVNLAIAYYHGTTKIPTTTYKFFHDIANGAGLATTDPALLLRNRMLSGFDKPTRLNQLWMVLRAMVLTKENVLGLSKLQLIRGSRASADDVMDLIRKLESYKDERDA